MLGFPPSPRLRRASRVQVSDVEKRDFIMRKTQIHFFLMDMGGRLHVVIADHVPRLGEEVRLRADLFYRVENVVHCYDEEEESVFNRVNIRLGRIVEASIKKRDE